MEIRVNSQPLTFTLEDERTLGEVVQALERWLEGSPLVLASVRRGDDGRELLAEPPASWADTPHEQVDRLEVTVRHSSELRLANLHTLLEYLQLASDFAAAGGPEARLAELRRGLSPFLESLGRHFAEAETGEQAGVFSFLLDAGGGPEAWGPEARERLGRAAADLSDRIQARLGEQDRPLDALRSLSGELEAAAEGVSEVSLLLATGRDREAMQTVVRFTELTQRLLSLAGALPEVDGQSAAEYFGALNRILNELLQAFQARDTVLIGDLLEYEIAPRLRQLRGAL